MKHGFTVVELIIVVAVISILISISTFGASALLKTSQAAEGKSEMNIMKSALEKYYAKNNEYPSMAQLAGSGNGRALTDTQYKSISTLLGVSMDTLKGGRYNFMPCWVSGSICCTMNAQNECSFLATDTKYLIYMTRTASDVAAGNVARTYRGLGVGCAYTFPAPATPQENGYSAYFLMYYDPSDTDTWTAGRIHSSDRGKTTRGAWCIVNKQ